MIVGTIGGPGGRVGTHLAKKGSCWPFRIKKDHDLWALDKKMDSVWYTLMDPILHSAVQCTFYNIIVGSRERIEKNILYKNRLPNLSIFILVLKRLWIQEGL